MATTAPTAEEIAAGVPADANIKKRIPGPNGVGTIAVDDQGGVYTFGGAEFYGSYWSPEMEQHRNDPNRRFTDITLEGGGYRIHSGNPGELGYWFGPSAQTPGGGGGGGETETPEDTSLEEKSAKAEIDKLAADYGLDPDFVRDMWTRWTQTKDMNTIYVEMISHPAYKARFPGMDALRAKGRIIPESQYIAEESTIKGLMSFYGLPPGFYDEASDFGALIGGEVSPKEIEERISTAAYAAQTANPEVRSELRRIYGLGDGDLTAYFLDPERAMPVIQKQVAAANISGAAVSSGFGQLSQTEAEALGFGGRNLTAEQAQRGFEEVSLMAPLFAETAEERTDLGRTEQLGVAAGDIETRKQVERRRQRRAARFEGGGGAASFGEGKSGLG